jgi:hypothetical protein
MIPLIGMVVGSLGSALAAAAIVGDDAGAEIVLGMCGPLTATAASWVVVERGYRRNPVLVTVTMLKAFAVKVLFFLAYVALMIAGFGLRPAPFVASLTVYFIALYAAEALLLRRLFLGAAR